MPSSDVESGLEVSRNSWVNVGADGDGYAEPKPVKQSEPLPPLPTHARACTPPSFHHNSLDFSINIFPPQDPSQGLIFAAAVDKVPALIAGRQTLLTWKKSA